MLHRAGGRASGAVWAMVCLAWACLGAYSLVAQEAAPPADTSAEERPAEEPAQAKADAPASPDAGLTPEQKRARERESRFLIDLPDETVPAPTDVALRPAESKPAWRLILNALFQLAVVVGIIYAGAYLVRRSRYGATLSPGASRMRVLDTLRLGADRSLHVVEVDGRLLLIGSAPHAMSLISELDSLPSPRYDTFGAVGDEGAPPGRDEGEDRGDFFDHLVHAERGFDIADLTEEAEPPRAAGTESPRRADPLARAMDVLESIERRRRPPPGGPGAAGVYDRRGRLR